MMNKRGSVTANNSSVVSHPHGEIIVFEVEKKSFIKPVYPRRNTSVLAIRQQPDNSGTSCKAGSDGKSRNS